MKSNWLIISYFANIDAMAPSHHIDDRLPFFAGSGIDARLLSSPCGIRHCGIPHTRVPSLAPSGIRYEVRHFLRRRTGKKFWFKFWETLILLPVYPFYFLEKILLRLDSTWSWCLTASVAAAVLSLKYRPTVIYSTGGPVSAHLAAMTASRLTGIPHIAEFQDPLVHQYAAPGKFERHFIKKVEGWIAGSAAALVFLTEKAAENARGRNPGQARVAAIHAGAAPLPLADEAPHEGMIISHFGSLGGTRNLDHLFPALVSLVREDPALAAVIRVSLYGAVNRSMKKQIAEFPFPKILAAEGKVSRSESLRRMAAADLLLLIQNTDDVSFETIPSKVYEYLHTGRPILGLVYRNPELRAMLHERGHVVVEADDDEAIMKALKHCVTQWRNGGLGSSPSPSPYTVEAAVKKLRTLVEEITGACQASTG